MGGLMTDMAAKSEVAAPARPSRILSAPSEWHFEQRIFDIISDSLPDQHKAKLENPSYREGDSKEGNTLEEFRRSQIRSSP